MKNSKFFAILFFIALFVGGMSIYYYSTPSLEKMVGQMIMTGFHGDGLDTSNEDFIAIEKQISSGQIGGVILFDVDISGLTSAGMDIATAKKQIFSSNIKI